MGKDLETALKGLLGVEEGSTTEEIIDLVLSVAPYISKLRNAVILHRLQKRVKENEEQLIRIGNKVNLLDEPLKEMLQNTIFPFVLDDLMEEHQEKKVEFILDGFEYVVDEKIREEAYIISYYDVLRELRIEDLKRLLEYTRKFKQGIGKEISKNRKELSYTDKDLYYKEASYRRHIDYKLESKWLIGNDKDKQIEQISDLVNHRYYSDDKYRTRFNRGVMDSKLKRASETKLTRFGNDLIKVFNLEILMDEIK